MIYCKWKSKWCASYNNNTDANTLQTYDSTLIFYRRFDKRMSINYQRLLHCSIGKIRFFDRVLVHPWTSLPPLDPFGRPSFLVLCGAMTPFARPPSTPQVLAIWRFSVYIGLYVKLLLYMLSFCVISDSIIIMLYGV